MTIIQPARGRGASVSSLNLWFLLALAASLVAALPLLIGPGIVNTRAGGDSPFLLQRVHQLLHNAEAGTLPAHWMPDAAYGLGYPAFGFYAALPYYVAALFARSGCGILWGIKIAQAMGFLLAGAATYALAREMGVAAPGAFLASAAYNLAPFHLVNVYVRGDSLSEFYAMGLYPLILWALLRTSQRRTASNAALLAVTYGSLILCHNISALIFSPLLGLCLLALSLRRGMRIKWAVLMTAGAALALGLLLSACFWMPALRERSLVQLQEQTTGYLHFAGHFRAEDLVQRRLFHSYAIHQGTEPFSMGLLQALLGLAGLVALGIRWRRREKASPGQWMAAFSLLVYTGLMTPSSRWVWDHVPLLPYVQFPWRLYAVQALAVAILAINLPALLPGRSRAVAALMLGLAVAVAGLAGIHPDRLPVQEGEVTGQRLMLYETYSGNIGSTIRHEYLPRWMVPRPYTSGVQLAAGKKPAPLALEGALREATLMERSPEREIWDLTVEGRSLLAFHTTFYPGWEAWIDGRAQGVEPLDGLGLVGLRVPEGAHRVKLCWTETPIRRYAGWVSMAAVIVLGALAAYPALRSSSYRRGLLVSLGVLAAWGGWLTIAPQPRSTEGAGPAIMDFQRAPYLHREPDGVHFGPVCLLDYHLSEAGVTPGQAIRLRLTWQASRPQLTVTARLVGATAHLFNPAPVWASASSAIASADTELALDLPDTIPPGLYVIRLEVADGAEELTPADADGQEMSRLALQPLQIAGVRPADDAAPPLGTFGPEHAPPVIALLDAQVLTRDETQVEIALAWHSLRQAPLNYWLSLRLKRPDGNHLVTRDLPPCLGGYPTALWRPGQRFTDRVILDVPDRGAPGPSDVLEVVLYDRRTLQAAGTVVVDGLF